ncbi:MAG: LON peptidase substrate-binding domain-containing protein [Gammaproteobacteria bacterium]|nr:LON peptidase substrate-binding domain-containing protein [Gammaproteobacteria bacterium]
MAVTIPLFPLNTVLFPGGVLPLRVFEPRYLDMVSTSLRSNTAIGVVLIREGREVGPAPKTHLIGTLGEICYFNTRHDGLLGVTLRGTQRFRILSSSVQADQLILAEVEPLDNVAPYVLPHKYTAMEELLRKILAQLEPPYSTMPVQYDDLEWVSARLCELLPMPLSFKQELLQLDDTAERIQRLHLHLHQLETA